MRVYYLLLCVVKDKENTGKEVYRKFGIFPFAYSDVIGRAVTHGGSRWNRNTFLLWRKFLFVLPSLPIDLLPSPFPGFLLFIHSFILSLS